MGGRQRLHRRTPAAAATTGSSCASRSASSLCGNRSPTTRSSPSSPRSWVCATSTPTAARPSSTGSRGFFDISDLPKEVSWEEFNRKGYHIININDDYKPTPGLRWFYEGRPCDTPDLGNPKRLTERRGELGTFSGKIEFESESLKQYFPDDEERPVVPRYIPSWEGYQTEELFDKYPLPLMSPHPRLSFHCHYDKHTDWLNDIPVHRIKKDGYAWWPARINPEDAAKRGINNDDIVRLYNDRGSVLCIAVVTGRVRPGIIHSYASSALYDPLQPGDPTLSTRAGASAC